MSASVAAAAAGIWAALLGRSSSGSSEKWAEAWLPFPAAGHSSTGAAAAAAISGLWLLLGLVAFFALAYATNPSEASFRSHLTDLSFHLHLRRLRAHELETSSHSQQQAQTQLPGGYKHDPAPTNKHAPAASLAINGNSGHASDASGAGGSAVLSGKSSASNKRSLSKARNSQARSASAPKTAVRSHQGTTAAGAAVADTNSLEAQSTRSHVLNFSSRVSISLRTPSYTIRNHGIFSLARILPPASPASTAAAAATKATVSASIAAAAAAASKQSKKSKRTASRSANHITQTGAEAKATSAATATAAAAKEPWSAQGGFFVGFLGYWWTIDDGTSSNGARERARLSNLVTALEEEKDEPSVESAAAPVAERLRTTKKSNAPVPDISETIVDEPTQVDTSAAATAHSTTAATAAAAGQNGKPPARSLTNGNGNATIRGGQRRSSPVPRGNSTGSSSKKKGQQSQSAASASATSGVSAASAAGGQGSATGAGVNQQQHVRTVSGAAGYREQQGVAASGRAQNGDARSGEPATKPNASVTASVTGKKDAGEEEEASISLISHSASAASAAVSAITPAAAHLQSQLDDLRTTSAATQARLEGELSDLRSRNKDEDAVRAELKVRTKALEEGKRAAEGARMEAERRVIAARGSRKALEDRVGKTRAELGKLEKREREIQEKLVRSRAEREEKLAKLKLEVESREEALKKEIEATARLEDRVHALEIEIEDRKLELGSLRDDQAQAAAAAQAQAQAHQQQQIQAHGPPPQRTRAGSTRHPNAATPVLLNSSSTTSSSQSVSTTGAGAPPGLAPAGNATTARPPKSAQNLQALFEHHGQSQGPSQSQSQTQGIQMFPFPDETPLRPPTPSKTPPGLANRAPGAVSQSAAGNAFGSSSFLDGSNRTGSGRQGSAAPAAGSALYRRMNLGEDAATHSSRLFGNGTIDEDDDESSTRRSSLASGSFGSFAPFGPASPAPSDTSNSTATSPKPKQAAAESEGGGYFSPGTTLGSESAGGKSSPGIGISIAPPGPISPPSRSSTQAQQQSHAGAQQPYGPLSPMTPHQASLIPSHLFDLLDADSDELEREQQGSPSPALSSSHGSGGAGSHFPKHMRAESGSPTSSGGSGSHARNFSGGAGAWGDIAVGNGASAEDSLGLDLDKPLYAGFGTGSGGVSRRTSGRKGGGGGAAGYSPLLESSSAHSNAAFGGDSIFSLGHGHHGGSLGSIGTRSSSTGSISPSLASATQGHPTAPLGSGKMSPNDLLLLEKARHAALALNPDAKAFSFNRPLPASSSSSSLGANSSKMAFEASQATIGVPGQNPTWASPLLSNRGPPSGAGQGQQQARAASNPVSASASTSNGPGSSFSPFDDDDLLKRW